MLSPTLDYDASVVNEALAVVGNTVGLSWLANTTTERRRGTPYPERRHRLGSLLAIAGEEQVVEFLELAEYLKAAASSGIEMTAIGHGLRNAYESTLLQLAFFYRLRRAGASDVQLEPPVDGSRFGDIIFSSQSGTCVVECYRPATPARSLGEIDWLANQALDEAISGKFPLSICIDLKSMPTASERKRLVRIVAALRRAHEGNRFAGLLENRCLIDESRLAIASVGRIPERTVSGPHECVRHPAFRLDKPDLFMGARRVPAAAVFSVQNPNWQGPPIGHVAVWFARGEPAEEHASAVLRVLPYLKKKLAQTKKGQTARWLVVEHPLAGNFHCAPQDDLNALKRRLFEAHRGVGGVLFVRRAFDRSRGRFRYVQEVVAPSQDSVNHLCRLPTLESTLVVPAERLSPI